MQSICTPIVLTFLVCMGMEENAERRYLQSTRISDNPSCRGLCAYTCSREAEEGISTFVLHASESEHEDLLYYPVLSSLVSPNNV